MFWITKTSKKILKTTQDYGESNSLSDSLVNPRSIAVKVALITDNKWTGCGNCHDHAHKENDLRSQSHLSPREGEDGRIFRGSFGFQGEGDQPSQTEYKRGV